jgi:hypothetical protein
MTQLGSADPGPAQEQCAECRAPFAAGQERVKTDDAQFCRPCFDRLTFELQQAVAAQGEDVNYAGATLGALLGAAVGIVAWWGFTVLTGIAFGLVAVVIGMAVSRGVILLSGGKRHRNLQVLSVVVSTAAFGYASYLVNRSFILKAMAEKGEEVVLPLVPPPELFFRVVGVSSGVMDLVFLAIVVYEAWRIPAPIQLAGSPSA